MPLKHIIIAILDNFFQSRTDSSIDYLSFYKNHLRAHPDAVWFYDITVRAIMMGLIVADDCRKCKKKFACKEIHGISSRIFTTLIADVKSHDPFFMRVGKWYWRINEEIYKDNSKIRLIKEIRQIMSNLTPPSVRFISENTGMPFVSLELMHPKKPFVTISGDNLLFPVGKNMLKDRTENVLKFVLLFHNLENKKIIDFIKKIEIDLETDRGDQKTLLFKNVRFGPPIEKSRRGLSIIEKFYLAEEKQMKRTKFYMDEKKSKDPYIEKPQNRAYDYDMLQIDNSYRTRPRIILKIKQCRVELTNEAPDSKYFNSLNRMKSTIDSINNQVIEIKLGGRFGRFLENFMAKLVFLSLLTTFTTAFAIILKPYEQIIHILGYGSVLIFIVLMFFTYLFKSAKESQYLTRLYHPLFREVDKTYSI